MDCKDKEPEYLQILSKDDLDEYNKMRYDFSSQIQQMGLTDTFKNVLDVIKNYSVRHNEDDYKRCDCCGVCWLPDKIGVNTNRLSYLTGQQKNNINCALNELMYVPASFTEELYSQIPTLQGNLRELRMWSIRKLQATETPNPCIRVSYIKRTTVKKTVYSPKPNLNGFCGRQWSYEEFTLTTEESDNFFCDPYAIPLDAWRD